jgi:hypothetical protein
MSFKKWVIYLADGFKIIVHRRLERGNITDFSIVLAYDEECITRYDTAHGAAHRDLLGQKQGLIEKRWCESLPINKVFTNAIEDLTQNYQAHLDFFRTH